MELNQLFQIWDRFESSSVQEMDLDMNGSHIHLIKDSIENKKDIEKSFSSAPPLEEKKTDGSQTNDKTVKAPLLGTFYQAASPDAEPFVSVGQSIKKGDVIGIIEAMKLMNEVHSTEDGKVKEILVEDGGLVEFDQDLIIIG